MKKNCFMVYIFTLYFIIHIPYLFSNTLKPCVSDVTSNKNNFSKNNLNNASIYIYSDHVQVYNFKQIIFYGNVHVKYGNNILQANQVQLNQTAKCNGESIYTITATGNINYVNNNIKLTGNKVWFDINTKDIYVYNGKYQITGQQGHGTADTLKSINSKHYTILKNGTYTSCVYGNNSWIILGTKVILDHKNKIIKIWNAQFKIGKIPIFYSPYLSIPINNQRRSGFLVPQIKYSNSNGLELSIPYYLNLASHYDLTVTTHYISNYGIQLQNEFRYLYSHVSNGLIELDWLLNNYQLKKRGNHRWLIHWHNNNFIKKTWNININYTKVSDANYFEDLNSKYGSSTDRYVAQKFSVSYINKYWNNTLYYKQFQIFDQTSNNYRVIPQLDINFHKDGIGPFDFRCFMQAVKFNNIHNNNFGATRLHIEPVINLPLINYWGNLNTEIKLMATNYKQKNNHDNQSIKLLLKNRVNRVIPQFKIDGKIVLKRNMHDNKNYIQTLEPHLQYLYIPYHNQNNIGIYDTTILQVDYFSLFRDRSYSGLDRITSANQFVNGITTHVYNANCTELFSAAFGQIYHFSEPITRHFYKKLHSSHCNNINVSWAAESFWQINNHWDIHGDLLYDNYLEHISLGNAILQYKYDKNHIFQMNYHYASPRYIEQMLSDNNIHSNFQQGISQIGITGNWNFINHCSLIGAYFYNIKYNQMVDQLLGLKFNTCCWNVNLGYERKIIGWDDNVSSSKYDNKISFIIELRGLNHKLHTTNNQIINTSI